MTVVGPVVQALNALFSPVLPPDLQLTQLVSCYARTRASESGPWTYFLVPFSAAVEVPVPIWFGPTAPGTNIAPHHGQVSATLGFRSLGGPPPYIQQPYAELEIEITDVPPGATAPRIELVVSTTRTVLIDAGPDPQRLSVAEIAVSRKANEPLTARTNVRVDIPDEDGYSTKIHAEVSMTKASGQAQAPLAVRLFDGAVRRQRALFGTSVGRSQLPAVVRDLLDDLLLAPANSSIVRSVLSAAGLLGLDLPRLIASLANVPVMLDAEEILTVEADRESNVTEIHADVDQPRGRVSFAADLKLPWSPSSCPNVTAAPASTGPIVRYTLAAVRPDGSVSVPGPGSVPRRVTPRAEARVELPAAPPDVPFAAWRVYRSYLVDANWSQQLHVTDAAAGAVVTDTPRIEELDVRRVSDETSGELELKWNCDVESTVTLGLRAIDGMLNEVAPPFLATSELNATAELPTQATASYEPTPERMRLGWVSSAPAELRDLSLKFPRDGLEVRVPRAAVPRDAHADLPVDFASPIGVSWNASAPTPIDAAVELTLPNRNAPFLLAVDVELPAKCSGQFVTPPEDAQPSLIALGWRADHPAVVRHVRVASTDHAGHPALVDARAVELGANVAVRVESYDVTGDDHSWTTVNLGGWQNAAVPGTVPVGTVINVDGEASTTRGVRYIRRSAPPNDPVPTWDDGPGLDATINTVPRDALTDIRASRLTEASVRSDSNGDLFELHTKLEHGGGPTTIAFTAAKDDRFTQINARSPDLPTSLRLDLWTVPDTPVGTTTTDLTWNANAPTTIEADATLRRAPAHREDWKELRLEHGSVTLPAALTASLTTTETKATTATAPPETRTTSAVAIGAIAGHAWGPLGGNLTLVRSTDATEITSGNVAAIAPSVAVTVVTVDTDVATRAHENVTVQVGTWSNAPRPGERSLVPAQTTGSPTSLRGIKALRYTADHPPSMPPAAVTSWTAVTNSYLGIDSTSSTSRTEARLTELLVVGADVTIVKVDNELTNLTAKPARIVTGGGPASLHYLATPDGIEPSTLVDVAITDLPTDIRAELDLDVDRASHDTNVRGAWEASSAVEAGGSAKFPTVSDATDPADKWDLVKLDPATLGLPAVGTLLYRSDKPLRSTTRHQFGWHADDPAGPIRAHVEVHPAASGSPRIADATTTRVSVGTVPVRLAALVQLPDDADLAPLIVRIGDWMNAPPAGALADDDPDVGVVPGQPPVAPPGWPHTDAVFIDHALTSSGRSRLRVPRPSQRGLSIDAIAHTDSLEARVHVASLSSLLVEQHPGDPMQLLLEACTGGGPFSLRVKEADDTGRTPGTDVSVRAAVLPTGVRATVFNQRSVNLYATWQATASAVLTGRGTFLTYSTPIAADFTELTHLRIPVPQYWTFTIGNTQAPVRDPRHILVPPRLAVAIPPNTFIRPPSSVRRYLGWYLDLSRRREAGLRAGVGWVASEPVRGVRARIVDHPFEEPTSLVDVFAESAPGSAAIDLDIPAQRTYGRLLVDIGRWENQPTPGSPPTGFPSVATGLEHLRTLRLRLLAHPDAPVPLPVGGDGPAIAADIRLSDAGLDRFDLRASAIHRLTFLQAERTPDKPEDVDLQVSARLQPSPVRFQLHTIDPAEPWTTLQVRADEVGPSFGVHITSSPTADDDPDVTTFEIIHTDPLGEARGDGPLTATARGMRVFFESGGRADSQRPATTHAPIAPAAWLDDSSSAETSAGGLHRLDGVVSVAINQAPDAQSGTQSLVARIDAVPPGASLSLGRVPGASGLHIRAHELSPSDGNAGASLERRGQVWTRGPTHMVLDLEANGNVDATLGSWVSTIERIEYSERGRFWFHTTRPFESRWQSGGCRLLWRNGAGSVIGVHRDGPWPLVQFDANAMQPLPGDWCWITKPTNSLSLTCTNPLSTEPARLWGRVGASLEPGWGLVGVTAAQQARIEAMPDCEPTPSTVARDNGSPVAVSVRAHALHAATLTTWTDPDHSRADRWAVPPMERPDQADTAWKLPPLSWLRVHIDSGRTDGERPLSVVIHNNDRRPPRQVLDDGLAWDGDPHNLGRYTPGRGNRVSFGRHSLEARVPRCPSIVGLLAGPNLMEIEASTPSSNIVMRSETAQWLRGRPPFADIGSSVMTILELPKKIRFANGWKPPTLGGGVEAGTPHIYSTFEVKDWQLKATNIQVDGPLRLGRSPSIGHDTLARNRLVDLAWSPSVYPIEPPEIPQFVAKPAPWQPGGAIFWSMTDIWFLTLEPTGTGRGDFTIYQPGESVEAGDKAMQMSIVDAKVTGRIMSVDLGLRQIESGWRAALHADAFDPVLVAEIQLSEVTGEFAINMQDLSTFADWKQVSRTTAGDWWICAYDKVEIGGLVLENAQFGSSNGTIDARNAPFDPPYQD